MDNGVQFVLNNFEKTIDLVSNNEHFKKYKKRVLQEYSRIKYIKHTGNMYEHFKKFKDGNHKYANDFKFLEEYGLLSNEKLSDYLYDNYQNEISNYSGIDDLIVGKIYSNAEICNAFGCSPQGGMRRAKRTNTLVLTANHNNPLYDDQWTDDGILNYTGMGKKGDQSISKAQNKTLALSNTNGIRVYLFESYKDNEYYYDGEVELAGPIYQSDELDEDQVMRKVVKFPLRRKTGSSQIIVDISDIEQSEKEKIKEVRKKSAKEIKEKAKIINNNDISIKEVKALYRERNQFVSEYTKDRANGICDLCGKKAPFKDKNGKPYLESHHVITLADGGPDGIYNTVAICPNCHRKIHVLKNKEDIEKLENIILKYLLADEDSENIKLWEELFR